MNEHDNLASLVMESTKPGVQDYHRLAANAAAVAANTNLDKRTREIYRFEEGKALLQAVFAHDPTLFPWVALRVAARIAERVR